MLVDKAWRRRLVVTKVGSDNRVPRAASTRHVDDDEVWDELARLQEEALRLRRARGEAGKVTNRPEGLRDSSLRAAVVVDEEQELLSSHLLRS